MPTAPVIVGSRQLGQLFRQTREAVAAGDKGIRQAAKNPLEAAAMAASLAAAIAAIQDAETKPGVFSSPRSQGGALLQTFLAQKAAEAGKVLPPNLHGREAQFDDDDWAGWAKSFFTWWKGIVPHAWQTAPSSADGIPNQCRVAVLADWGTGLYGAPRCATRIQTDGAYQVVMHLGDVYYSGDRPEIQERFLDLWPAVPGAINRAFNGNHEMYTGGWAYFDHVLGDPRFSQPASYFALQNDFWTLVGFDTAYKEHDLNEEQLPWLDQVLGAAGERRVVFFSHHQPFSLLSDQGPKLQAKLGHYLAAGRVFAWYWGHEHGCIVYERHQGWQMFGRCIGHSGYPYFRPSLEGPSVAAAGGTAWVTLGAREGVAPGAIVLDGANPYLGAEAQSYGPNGHVSLTFDNEHLQETFHLPDGTVVLENQLI
jgi:hypothetical protein